MGGSPGWAAASATSRFSCVTETRRPFGRRVSFRAGWRLAPALAAGALTRGGLASGALPRGLARGGLALGPLARGGLLLGGRLLAAGALASRRLLLRGRLLARGALTTALGLAAPPIEDPPPMDPPPDLPPLVDDGGVGGVPAGCGAGQIDPGCFCDDQSFPVFSSCMRPPQIFRSRWEKCCVWCVISRSASRRKRAVVLDQGLYLQIVGQ